MALNFQTGGEEMQLLHGRFLDNGNSGYVLKPQCLQSGNVTAPEDGVGGAGRRCSYYIELSWTTEIVHMSSNGSVAVR